MSRRLAQLEKTLRRRAIRAAAEKRLALRRWNEAVETEIASIPGLYLVDHRHPDWLTWKEKARQWREEGPRDVAFNACNDVVVVLEHYPEPPEPKPTQPTPPEVQ